MRQQYSLRGSSQAQDSSQCRIELEEYLYNQMRLLMNGANSAGAESAWPATARDHNVRAKKDIFCMILATVNHLKAMPACQSWIYSTSHTVILFSPSRRPQHIIHIRAQEIAAAKTMPAVEMADSSPSIAAAIGQTSEADTLLADRP